MSAKFDELEATMPKPLIPRDTSISRLFQLAVSADRRGFVGIRDGWLSMIDIWTSEIACESAGGDTLTN